METLNEFMLRIMQSDHVFDRDIIDYAYKHFPQDVSSYALGCIVVHPNHIDKANAILKDFLPTHCQSPSGFISTHDYPCDITNFSILNFNTVISKMIRENVVIKNIILTT